MSNNDPSVKMVSIKVPSFMQEPIENAVNKICTAPTFNTPESFKKEEPLIYQYTNSLGDMIVQQQLQTVCNHESMRQAGREPPRDQAGPGEKPRIAGRSPPNPSRRYDPHYDGLFQPELRQTET